MKYVKQKPSIKRNVSWTLLGNITLAASQFIILVVLAKLGSPEVVGQFTLSLAICSPIFLFLSFKLRSVQATDSKDEFRFADYYSLRTFSSLIAIIIISAIIIFSNYASEVKLIILVMGLSKFLEAQSDIFYGLFQKHEKMDKIAQSLIAKSLFNIISLTMIYYFTNNLLHAMIGLFITNLLIVILFDIPNSKVFLGNQGIRVIYTKEIKSLLILSLPLGFSIVLGSLNTNIPRYFLEMELGQYELGIFAGITYLLVAFGTVINAIAQAVTPRLSKTFASKRYQEFKKMVLRMNILGAGMGFIGIIVVYLFGEDILTLLYTKDYSKYSDVLLIVMLGAMLLYSSVFFGTAVTAMRRYKVQLPIHFCSFIMILACSFILISRYGIQGAAWTIFFGNLTTTIGYIIIYIIILSKNTLEDQQREVV